MQPELLLDARADLGEGPAWDASRGLLYWVDIHTGRLHTYDPGEEIDHWVNVGESLGCVAPRPVSLQTRGTSLVIALNSGFMTFNLPSQRMVFLANPEPHLTGNRFNDGKCDPAGRFLAGTMDDAEKEASGSLYSYSPDGTLKTLLTGVRISNGLTWSPDYQTFYYIDTPTRQVTAFDYDLATGNIANPRPVVNVPPKLGWPDGMTSDAEGMLWVAMWGGAKLTRWNPATGQLLEAIPVPALNVTSCVFGGPDLTDLYITSARKWMSAEQLAKVPLSGGLFRIRTKMRGMPTFEFGA
ncbi:MAG: SMP-30/gluconolactonase/LRE family protein [Anaerolineales bacterium]|nr:SMP-30/gluconolactonase/LRE family protein [Anaerolineales bacterium]